MSPLGNDRDNDLDPPFCRRGLLVGANGRAVDHLYIAIVGGGEDVHHPVPDARLSPSSDAIVAGGARTISFRQVAPRRTGPKHPKNTVQHAAIINTGHASRLIGQQRLDHAPFEVGQIVSAHAEPESPPKRQGKVFVGGVPNFALNRRGQRDGIGRRITTVILSLTA